MVATPPPFDGIELVSVFVQTLFYGCFSILYAICMWVLIYRRKTETINVPMLCVATSIFVLATAHLAICWERAWEAFILHDKQPLGALIYYAKINRPIHLAKSTIFTLITIVADSMLVYRCWIVWGKNSLVVIFPAILILAEFGMGIAFTYELSTVSILRDSILVSKLEPFLTGFYALTLGANLLTTFLIAYKIWKSSVAIGRATGNSLWHVIVILVESGAAYCITVIITLATYLADSTSQFIVMDALAPIIGITFSLIIIRVAMGVTSENATSKMSSGSGGRAGFRGSTKVSQNSFLSHSKGAYSGGQSQLQSYPPIVHINRDTNQSYSDDSFNKGVDRVPYHA